MKKPPGTRGFTLPELMTVVVIVGILAGLAMISINKGKAEGELDSFTNQIRNTVVQARRRAVGTASTYLVDITKTTVQYCQIDPNVPGQATCPTPNTALCSGALCENSRLIVAGPEATVPRTSNLVDVGQGPATSPIGVGHKQVYFYRDGTADSVAGSSPGARPTAENGATIYLQGLSNATKQRKILVYPISGRPRIIDRW